VKTLLSAVLVMTVAVAPALSQGYGDIDFGTATDSGSEGEYDTPSESGSDYGTTATYTPQPSYSPAEEEEGSALSAYISIGYGLGIGGVPKIGAPGTYDSEISFVTRRDDGTSLTEREDNYLNCGGGLKVEGGAYLRLARNVGAQLVIEETPTVPENTTTYTRNVLAVKLMLVPSFKVVDLIDVRTGVGLGVFFSGITSTNSDKGTYAFDGFIHTKPGLGLVGLIGADYPLGDLFAIFADIGFEAVNYTLKELRTNDVNVTRYFVKNSTADNEATPDKIPGTNVTLRIGAKIAVF
jgi:hypothetical protein